MHRKFLLTFSLVIACSCIRCFGQLVHISGTSKDTTIKAVDIRSSIWFRWNRSQIICESDLTSSDRFYLSFKQASPMALNIGFMNFGTRIFVTPGDSVEFEITQEKPFIKFRGKNAQNYNFYPQLEAAPCSVHPPRYEGDPVSYKKKINEWSMKRREFCDQYWKENPDSEIFRKQAAADINYHEYYLLLSPVSDGQLKISEIPSGYLPLNLPFNDEQLLDVHYFRIALIYKYILAATDKVWEKFDFIYKNINTNTTGKIRSFLLTTVVGLYARENRANYKESLTNVFDTIKSTITDSVCLAEIDISRDAYFITNRPIPDSVLTTTMLTEINSMKVISLKQLLDKHASKPMYFDFWASWCGACRVDIEDSGKSKKLLDSLGVDIVYVSLDKQVAPWVKAANADKILKNQYRLNDGVNSSLAKFLSLGEIPRYLLIDKNHMVKNTNAPRMSYWQYDKLRDTINELSVKIVKFD